MFNNNNCTFNSIGIKRKWYALLHRWKDWFHMWLSNVQISLELCPLLLNATLTHFIKTQQVDCILPFGFLNLLASWTHTIIFSLFSIVSLLCSAFQQIPVWRFSEIKWYTQHCNLGQVQIWVTESWSHCKEHQKNLHHVQLQIDRSPTISVSDATPLRNSFDQHGEPWCKAQEPVALTIGLQVWKPIRFYGS